MQPLQLLGRQPAHLARFEEALWARKRRVGVAVYRWPVAVGLGQLGFHARGLAARNALADYERGRRLVGGVEADRSQEAVCLLRRANYRVALPDRGPARAVVIDR